MRGLEKVWFLRRLWRLVVISWVVGSPVETRGLLETVWSLGVWKIVCHLLFKALM